MRERCSTKRGGPTCAVPEGKKKRAGELFFRTIDRRDNDTMIGVYVEVGLF